MDDKDTKVVQRFVTGGVEKRKPPPPGTALQDISDLEGNEYKIIQKPYISVAKPGDRCDFTLFIFKRDIKFVNQEPEIFNRPLDYQFDISISGPGKLFTVGGFGKSAKAHISLELPDKPAKTIIHVTIMIQENGRIIPLSHLPIMFVAIAQDAGQKPAADQDDGSKPAKGNTKYMFALDDRGKNAGLKKIKDPDQPPEADEIESTSEFEIPPSRPAPPDQKEKNGQDKKSAPDEQAAQVKQTTQPELDKEDVMTDPNQKEEQERLEKEEQERLKKEREQARQQRRAKWLRRAFFGALALFFVAVLIVGASLGRKYLGKSTPPAPAPAPVVKVEKVVPAWVDCQQSEVKKLSNGQYALKDCKLIYK